MSSRVIISARSLSSVLSPSGIRLAPSLSKYSIFSSKIESSSKLNAHDESSHGSHSNVSPKFTLTPNGIKLSPGFINNTSNLRTFATTTKNVARKPDNEVVVVENKLAELIDQEIEYLVSFEENELAEEEEPIEYEKEKQTFLDSTGFIMEEIESDNSVKLTRTSHGRTFTIQFLARESPESSLNPLDDMDEHEHENEQNEEEDQDKQNEVIEGKQVEEGEEGEEGDEDPHSREHPFSIVVSSEGKPLKLTLGGYGADDGSFLISVMSLEGKDGKPGVEINVAEFSDDLQNQLVQYLRPLGMNEELVSFMFYYMDTRKLRETLVALKSFKSFLG